MTSHSSRSLEKISMIFLLMGQFLSFSRVMSFYETAMGGNKIPAKHQQFLTYQSNLVFINTDTIHGHRVGDGMAMN